MNNIMCNVRRFFSSYAVKAFRLSLIAPAVMAVSCSDENEAFKVSRDAVELTGIETVITEQPLSTRADGNQGQEKLPVAGYIGRQFFVDNDEMVITKFQRTENSIIDYSYKDIEFKSNSGGAWSRTTSDPERIYWTDNTNHHTFIGYSCPQSWKSNITSKWKAVEIPATETEPKKVNYHGNFTFTSKTESNGAVVNEVDFSDSTKIAGEDILLTYDTDKQAETGGSVAILHYKHALASTKITVNILNFAADDNAQDVKTKVSDLQILDQPYKYMWGQIPVSNVNGIDHPGWGAQMITPNPDEVPNVNIKTWLRDTEGNGTNRNKKFVFRSLIVPGKQTEVKLRFKVTYPQALNPSETITKTYTATLRGTKPGDSNGVYFEPGKTTNINISLNHKNEAITIGAEYVDWENVETPDETDLSKYSTYLDTTERDSVTIAGDAKATADDATWLYLNASNQLVDIYGNHGTENDPFEIRNARQFLSFAYEVKGGNNGAGLDFKDKFVRLDASLLLQPTESVDDTLSYATIDWIGIGDASKPFNGTFLGGMRYVRYLKGKPLFMNIGEYGRVEGLTLDRVLGLTDGGGMVAGTNSGTICATMAEVHKKNSGFAGADLSGICGTNNGAIVACGVIGNISTPIAGICAKNTNTGSITASYAGINNSGLVTTNSGTINECYYDNGKAVSPTSQTGAEGLPTLTMQRTGFVETLNTALQGASEHAKTHTFQYRAAYYPKAY